MIAFYNCFYIKAQHSCFPHLSHMMKKKIIHKTFYCDEKECFDEW